MLENFLKHYNKLTGETEDRYVFHHLQNVLEKYHPNPLGVKEIYIKQRMPYDELYQHKAAVMFPYDTSLMMFWEFYS